MKRFAHLMKPHLGFLRGWKGALAILLLWRAVATPNAQPQSTNKASVTGTNAPVAQSLFIMPPSRKEGVDPFFPRSNRPYGPAAPIMASDPEPVKVAVDLRLKAISGLPEHRLALINNHTFEAGEEGEIITTNGRMRIRCLEITQDSAVVQVGPERRELHLRY
jgi:hypothetical protein